MVIKQCRHILSLGNVENEQWFHDVSLEIESAIKMVVNPPGAPLFRINPTKQGNGVVPIKKGFVSCLKNQYGWGLEVPVAISSCEMNAGPIDAVKEIPGTGKKFAVEWETGNISSTHRALNKIALGVLQGTLIGGALVLPSRKLYNFLTDRIGSFSEIEPYFLVWASIKFPSQGVISVYEIEHDLEDATIPCIPKGTDGRAKKRKKRK